MWGDGLKSVPLLSSLVDRFAFLAWQSSSFVDEFAVFFDSFVWFKLFLNLQPEPKRKKTVFVVSIRGSLFSDSGL